MRIRDDGARSFNLWSCFSSSCEIKHEPDCHRSCHIWVDSLLPRRKRCSQVTKLPVDSRADMEKQQLTWKRGSKGQLVQRNFGSVWGNKGTVGVEKKEAERNRRTFDRKELWACTEGQRNSWYKGTLSVLRGTGNRKHKETVHTEEQVAQKDAQLHSLTPTGRVDPTELRQTIISRVNKYRRDTKEIGVLIWVCHLRLSTQVFHLFNGPGF